LNALNDYLRRGDRAIEYYIGPHAYGALTSALDTLSPVQDYQSVLQGAQQAGEGIVSGDWREMAKGGMGTLAGIGAVMLPGNQRPVMAAADGRRGITAYHGSPHDFDQFDISKIGTGEGAQAYGHGLYFADKEGVARSYRNALAGKASPKSGQFEFSTSGEFTSIGELTGTPELGLESTVIKDAFAKVSGAPDAGEVKSAKIFDLIDELSAKKMSAPRHERNIFDSAIEKLLIAGEHSDELSIKNPKKGIMYKVHIDANPEDFLDWDRPLSEQPEAVRKIAQPRIFKKQDGTFEAYMEGANGFPKTFSGATAEEATAKAMEGLTGAHAVKGAGYSPELNARVLKEAGIPGIRYLDQGSRAAGDGSRNYVVFDDKLITILKKYGLVPAAVTAGMALNTQDVQAAVTSAWGDMSREDRRKYLESQDMIPETAD